MSIVEKQAAALENAAAQLVQLAKECLNMTNVQISNAK